MLYAGTIPVEFRALKALSWFYFDQTFVSGVLPEAIGSWKALDIIMLHRTLLSGAIPSTLSSCTSMRTFSAYNSRLSGTLAPTIGSLTSLEKVLMYAVRNSSHISGSLPTELARLHKLVYFYLSGHHLSGTIPSTLSLMTSIQGFMVASNELSGTLSRSLASWTLLDMLHLSNNRFSGTSSPEFRDWRTLKLLSAQNTDLSWNLDVVNSWPYLSDFIMSNTYTSGTVPARIQPRRFRTLLASATEISGTLATHFFTNATNLLTFDISATWLSGTLPESLSAAIRLRAFLANDNLLSGALPPFPAQADTFASESDSTNQFTATENPFIVAEGSCQIEAGAPCVTSPNFPNDYNNLDKCVIRISKQGYISTTAMQTEPKGGSSGDTLTVNWNIYSGVEGPEHEFVEAGSEAVWKTDRTRLDSGWRLCWAAELPMPVEPQLQTFGIARNYLTGPLNQLRPETNLKTIIVSSNYFSCPVVHLAGDDNPGTGKAREPGNVTPCS